MTRAVEPALECIDGDAEGCGGLGSRESSDVAEHEHLSRGRVQVVDGRVERDPELSSRRELVRRDAGIDGGLELGRLLEARASAAPREDFLRFLMQ